MLWQNVSLMWPDLSLAQNIISYSISEYLYLKW